MGDLTETILIGVVSGLTADALWESGKWAWKNREGIRSRIERIPKPITVPMNPANLRAEAKTVTVSALADLRWKVESPAPSLARRLEDFAAWYLHVS
jgi:hypothetical protein